MVDTNKNISNIRVYGDDATMVFLAPKGGATLPTTLAEIAALPEPWEPVGWLSEDGVDFDVSVDSEKFKGLQGGATVRTKVTGTEKSIKIQALEESPIVSGVFWGHGAPTVSGTGADKIARIDLPKAIPTVERQLVAFFVDGDVEKAVCCDLAQATDRGTLGHKNSDMTIYEITFELVGDTYILTNAPAFTGA